MKAYLIDPFQRTVHALDVPAGLDALYRALDCEMVDCVELEPIGDGFIDLWIDDEGTMRSPPWPHFRLNGDEYAGYGLICESRDGARRAASFDIEWFKGKLAFERWEDRLNAFDYFDQLTRVPAWEFPLASEKGNLARAVVGDLLAGKAPRFGDLLAVLTEASEK